VLGRAEDGEHAVDGEALPERRPLVDGGADQGMAKAHRGAVGVAAEHQAGPLTVAFVPVVFLLGLAG
jgi:hypothetical protein